MANGGNKGKEKEIGGHDTIKERRNGERIMPTKQLEREETLPGNSLRSLSQKSLVELVHNYEKLGLIVNNNLEIAMISWDSYEKIVDLLNEQEEQIQNLVSFIEDIQLAKEYGDDILRAEKDRSTAFVIDDVDELFDRLD